MSNWKDPSWQMRVGINHVPAFQTSGRPFASGGIDAHADQQVVNFPYVTRWIQVVNDGSGSVKVGFGPNAFVTDNKNYFTVPSGSTSDRMEVKVSRIYVKGGDQTTLVASASPISVVAGLTSIGSDKVNFPTGSKDQWHLDSNGISWSGSYNGVG
tara:strand:- start:126 stop:590 length:465 start_codon:yes stop_codon:yes gene_type:complete